MQIGAAPDQRRVWAVRLAGVRRSDAVNADLFEAYRDMGVSRVVTTLPPDPAEKTLPVLDRCAALIRRANE